jgi:hypothetical protein
MVRKMACNGDVLDFDYISRKLVGDVPRDLDWAVYGYRGDLDARGVRVGMAVHVGFAQRLQIESRKG